MRLAAMRPGDLVQCDIKGRRFHAEVVGPAERGIAIRPLQTGISYRHARPRDVIAHWRKARHRNTQSAPATVDNDK